MRSLRFGKRLTALLLALALCLGLMPGTAFAQEPDYKFTQIEYMSSMIENYVTKGCYYADEWFTADPSARNDALALLSATVAAAAGDEEHGAAALEALGFTAAGYRYDSGDASDCAYCAGTKTVAIGGKELTLAAVVFQGDRYGLKGWQQNVTVNIDGEDGPDHASYALAANAFLSDFDALGLADADALWIVGQSRGGAVANVAAAYLLDRAEHPAVFCRTLESPRTTQSASAHDALYAGIHNYVADDDPVPMIPPWDMTRYGQEFIYNTAPIEDVLAEMATFSPDAAEYAKDYDPDIFGGSVKDYMEMLVGNLEEAAPTRESYSAAETVAVGGRDPVEWTYQGGLQALCLIVFGDSDDMMGRMITLLGYLPTLAYAGVEETYAKAQAPENAAELLADAQKRRLTAASDLHFFLAFGGETPVTTGDLYALLTLLTPMTFDLSAAAEEGWELPPFEDFNAIDYMVGSGLLTILEDTMTPLFSHHPDAIIARLSLLAPAPEMKDLAIEIPAPAAQDAADAAPKALAQAVEAMDHSWLTLQDAAWTSEDETLQDGKVYYLKADLAVEGYKVPEDAAVTLNEQAPQSMELSADGGKTVITAVWLFAVGEPQNVSVIFDANGHGETPKPAEVLAGTELAYAGLEMPDLGRVTDEEGTWRFDGWLGENGESWESLTADGEIVLKASWTRLIDAIELTYEIPRVGDSGDKLTAVSIPEGAPYQLEVGELQNGKYITVSEIAKEEPLHFSLFVSPAGEGIEFLTKTDKSGDEIYEGTITMNGEPLACPWGSWSVYREI
ncbi:MAG: hypothetical protein K5981_05800, partial [Clostridia bacterium]|nr:hypothetical protein [Clostridia bacterium]